MISLFNKIATTMIAAYGCSVMIISDTSPTSLQYSGMAILIYLGWTLAQED